MAGRNTVKRVLATIALLGGSAMAFSAAAQDNARLAHIRAAGVVSCAAVPRPLLAEPGRNGQPQGLLVDLCHAIARAALNGRDHINFTFLNGSGLFGGTASGLADVSFGSFADLSDDGLIGQTLPGPRVALIHHAIMVPKASGLHGLADLAGKTVCDMQGSGAGRSLEAALAGAGVDIVRMAYTEQSEMIDAYDAAQCVALADESERLDAWIADKRSLRPASRLLAEPLASIPMIAATPRDDAAWSAIVAWTIATLRAEDLPGGTWRAAGAAALPVAGSALGLPADWQKQVTENGKVSYARLCAAAVPAGKASKEAPRPSAGQVCLGPKAAPPLFAD